MMHLAMSTYDPRLVAVRFKGARFWDSDGKSYLDFASGPGVANIGWNHPALTKALAEFILDDHAGYGGNEILNPWQIQLAEKIAGLMPGGKDNWRVFFSNSGGEAVEAGVVASILRRPERKALLSFVGDFHGRMGFSRSATTSKPEHFLRLPQGPERMHTLIFPGDNPATRELGWLKNPTTYLRYADAQIGRFLDDIDCAVIELVQGEGGINVPYGNTISELITYLRSHDIRILVDEVQTGFGRTGKLFSFELYGIQPDIVTIAKAASGGLIPIGITALRMELDYRKPREHSNTFGGNPQACFAALKVIEIIEREHLVTRASVMGHSLRALLNDEFSGLKKPWTRAIGTWGGIGLMQRLAFVDPTNRMPSSRIRDVVIGRALTHSLFLMGAGDAAIRLMPPLTVTQSELEEGVSKLITAIKEAV